MNNMPHPTFERSFAEETEDRKKFDDTFEVAVVQYLMPDGRQEQTGTRLSRELEPLYLDMVKHGCRFEAEMLRTRAISVTIFNIKDEEDVDISLTGNGPEVQAGMIAMLKRQLWKQQVSQ